MLRRFFDGLLILVLAAAAFLFISWPRLHAAQAQSPFDAAAQLRVALQQGVNELTFREEDIDLDKVYTALEAIYPYAFSMHATTRVNRTTTLRVEVSRPARQEQARVYAQQLVNDWITPDMALIDRLRALHDGLIRLCVYDVATAEGEEKDGATSPFAADGAILDHRAVCAGYGRAYVMLCEAADIHNVIYVSSEQMNHGWNAVRINGVTYYIDCTFDDPVPDMGQFVSDTYFLCNTKEFQENHQWDQSFYEQLLDSLEPPVSDVSP